MLVTMTGDWGMRLCAVHLVDALHCTDANKYVAGLIVSLCTMLQLELPHVNVMSKADLLEEREDELDFPLDFYTEVNLFGLPRSRPSHFYIHQPSTMGVTI